MNKQKLLSANIFWPKETEQHNPSLSKEKRNPESTTNHKAQKNAMSYRPKEICVGKWNAKAKKKTLRSNKRLSDGLRSRMYLGEY